MPNYRIESAHREPSHLPHTPEPRTPTCEFRSAIRASNAADSRVRRHHAPLRQRIHAATLLTQSVVDACDFADEIPSHSDRVAACTSASCGWPTSERSRLDFAQRLTTRHPIEAQASPTTSATLYLPTSCRSRYATAGKTLFNKSETLKQFNILSGLQTNLTHFAAARPTHRLPRRSPAAPPCGTFAAAFDSVFGVWRRRLHVADERTFSGTARCRCWAVRSGNSTFPLPAVVGHDAGCATPRAVRAS